MAIGTTIYDILRGILNGSGDAINVNQTGTAPLPTGAATASNQTSGAQKTQQVDGTGAVQGPFTAVSGVNYSPTILSSAAADGSPAPTRNVVIAGIDGSGNVQSIKVGSGGNLQVGQNGSWDIRNITGTAVLPTGAATAARQDTVISNLQAINSLAPSAYDYIGLAYTGSDLTSVVYKSGGSGGSTISTLTLAYTSSVLQSVTKT